MNVFVGKIFPQEFPTRGSRDGRKKQKKRGTTNAEGTKSQLKFKVGEIRWLSTLVVNFPLESIPRVRVC